jgi:hypothetical protein
MTETLVASLVGAPLLCFSLPALTLAASMAATPFALVCGALCVTSCYLITR